MHEVSVSSDFLDRSITFIFLLSFLINLKEMGSTDESFSHTGFEPKDYFLTETYAEFNQESMTDQPIPD